MMMNNIKEFFNNALIINKKQRTKLKSLLTILCLFFINFTWASNAKNSQGIEYPGAWTRFINSKNNTRYTAECNELKNGTGSIKCSFSQLRVLHNETEVNLLKEQLDELHRKTNKEIEPIILSMKKDCTDLFKINGKGTNKLKYSKNQEEMRMLKEFKKICDVPTRDNLTTLMNENIAQAEQTCTIYDSKYTSEFKYNWKTKQWVSQDEPSGPCGIISIEYFTKDSRKGFKDFAWHYTLKQIVTNKDGNALTVSCSKLPDVEEESGYSVGTFLYEKNQQMNCKYINLEAFA